MAKILQMRNFVNGRIGNVSDFLMPDSAVTDVKNMHFDILGKAKVRDGVTLIQSQVSNNYSCLGLYYFKSSTAANSQILSVFSDGTNNDIYYDNTGWTKILEDDTKDKKTRFTTFLDQVIRVNGTDNATAWFGTGAWSQNIGTGANDLNLDDMDSYDCSLVETYKARVYMAGHSTALDRLYYSTIVSTTPHIVWAPTTDYVDINPNDGDNISGLKRYALDLLVFKKEFVYRYRGIAGVDPEPLIRVGAYSQEGIVEAKNGMYFYHPSGIYIYAGGYPREISRPVTDFIEAIPSTYFTTVSSWVEADKDHVCFSIGDVTVGGVSWTNVVLRYTISSQVWTVYSYGTEIRRGTLYDNGTNEITAVGDDDGNIFTLNSGTTDNTAAINYHLTTKYMELGAAAESYELNKLASICEKAQGANISYQIDDSTKWNTIGQLRKYVNIFKPKIKGKRIRFKLFGSSKVAGAIYEGIEVLEGFNKGVIE